MPNIEPVNTVNIPAAPLTGNSPAASIPASKKIPVDNFIKSFILLIAIYSLIINRATDDKHNSHQRDQYESKARYDRYNTKAFVHASKKSKQTSLPLFYYSATPIVFHPPYLFLK